MTAHEVEKERFLKTVLKWRIEDIVDTRKFARMLKPIPLQFDNRKDYCEAFKWPLLDDTRAQLQNSLENIGSNAYIPVLDISAKSKARNDGIDRLIKLNLTIEGSTKCIKRNKRDSPWFPKGTDLAIVTTRVPETLEDLQGHGESYFFVEIVLADDNLVDPIKVVAPHCQATSLENLGILNRCWYLVSLDTLATRLRTWDALTPNPKAASSKIAEEILDSGRMQVSTHGDFKLENSVQNFCNCQGLNTSQTEAVVDAVTSIARGTGQRVKLVQGPPGTGKTTTTTVLVTIATCLKNRVLVCAPTNRAISEVAERFLQLMEASACVAATSQFSDFLPSITKEANFCRPLQLGDVVLLGNKQRIDTKGALEKIFLPCRSKRLAGALSQYGGWNASVKAFADSLGGGMKQFRDYDREQGQEKNPEKQKRWVDFLPFIRKKLEPFGESIVSSGQILCDDMPTKLLSPLQKEKIKETCALVEKLLEILATKSLSTADVEPCFSGSGEGDDGCLCPLQGRHTSSYAIEFCAVRNSLLKRNIGDASASLPKLGPRQGYRALEKHCLKHAALVFCTIAAAGSKAVKGSMSSDSHFNYVIVDEAAQVTEAETAMVTQLRGLEGLLLVGDPRQLQALVHSQRAKDCGFARSLFERLQATGHTHHMLREQRRMHPEISLFPSNCFYEGAVLDGPNVTSATYGIRLQGCPYGAYAFVDVENSVEEMHETSRSWQNPVEAEVVLRLVSRIRAEMSWNTDVGVITPYRGQAKLLQESLLASASCGRRAAKFHGTVNEWKKAKASDVAVKTVDGFQGGERDIIIFSAVRSNPSGNIGFLEDARRLNVALTRGRYCVWVVGNASTLQRKNELWRALIKGARERRCFWTYGHEEEFRGEKLATGFANLVL